MTYRSIQILGIQQPTYEIELGQLSKAYDICLIMEALDIRKYNYQFKFVNNTVKYGYSADVKSHNHGERVYRQAGHLDGWPTKLAPYSSGSEMEEINQLYTARYGHSLDRHRMKLRIIDMTNVVNYNLNDPNWPMKVLEREMIKRHKEQYGVKPVGNINEESHIDRVRWINQKTYGNFFNELT